uniref:Acid phosphatase n=1 Tax=Heterorhabditis bacteriophora TaxID=37862 RepID=A0A1I7WSS9_HETBA
MTKRRIGRLASLESVGLVALMLQKLRCKVINICIKLWFNSSGKIVFFQLIGGYLLNTWIENAVAVSNGTMKPKRMLWYSSHDGTILALLYAMGIGNDLMVPYASTVIMEVYENENQFEVELLYRNDTSRPPYKIPLPDCGTPCTVSKLTAIYKDMVVTSYEEMMELCGKPEKQRNGTREFSLLFLMINIITICISTNFAVSRNLYKYV